MHCLEAIRVSGVCRTVANLPVAFACMTGVGHEACRLHFFSEAMDLFRGVRPRLVADDGRFVARRPSHDTWWTFTIILRDRQHYKSEELIARISKNLEMIGTSYRRLGGAVQFVA